MSSEIPPTDPVPAAPPNPPTPTPISPPTAAPPALIPDPADVEKNKIFGILAYLGILFLVPLLAAKESPFARFHTNQGAVLFLCAICCWFPLLIIAFIPFVNFIDICLLPIVGISLLVFSIMGIVNAAQGKMTPLPIIGAFKLIK